jgi:hypothetical protein
MIRAADRGRLCSLTVVIASLAACGTSDNVKTDARFRADVVASMHESIGAELADLPAAARELQAAAPSRAWSATADARRSTSCIEMNRIAVVLGFPEFVEN